MLSATLRFGGDLRLADDQPAAGRLLTQFDDRAQRFYDSRKHLLLLSWQVRGQGQSKRRFAIS